MNRKTPNLDPRSSVTPDAINLKFGTRDYDVGATQRAKTYNNRPSRDPSANWWTVMFKCLFYFLFIFYFFVISCAAMENTFWEYRHRFCVKRRVPVGI